MNLIKTKSFELAINTKGNSDSKNLALLIPGRLDTKDYANFVCHAEYLANRGLFVVAFDPPGVWESRGAIDTYTTTNYIKAIEELIEYFGNKPTLLVGHSRGGAVSMLLSSHTAVFGIVLVMANYGAPTDPTEESLRKGFQVSYRDLPPGNVKTKEQKKFELPISYWKDGSLHDPVQALEKCTKPKLLVYGTRDEFISGNEVKEIYKKILDPKMILEVASEHDYRYNAEAIQKVNEVLGKFLDKYMTDGNWIK